MIAAVIAAQSKEAAHDIGAKIHEIGRPALHCATELAQDSRPFVRERAAFLLGQLEDWQKKGHEKVRDGIPTLLALLEHDPEENVRVAAAYALGHLGAAEAASFLLPLIESADSEARYAAAFALGSLDWESSDALQQKLLTREGLIQLARDQDAEVRDRAAFGLNWNQHDTPEVRALFWQLLDDSDQDVRGEAARGLAKFGEAELAPRLIELLERDWNRNYFYEAAESLGDPALLPAVQKAAERWKQELSEGKSLHLNAASALEVLTAKAQEN